jgi:hypothetical protein
MHISAKRATCFTHLIILDFITQIIIGEAYKLNYEISSNPQFLLSQAQMSSSAPHSQKTSAYVILSYVLT